MNTKRKIRKSQWTNFWKNLSIYVEKSRRFLKNYDTKQDEKKLLNIGVSQSDIDFVRKSYEKYADPLLQFHRFSIFFRQDCDTAVGWTKSSTVSQAFVKLFRKLKYTSFEKAGYSFQQLFLLHKLNERGEGKAFEANYVGHGSLDTISVRPLQSILSSHHQNASYKGLPKFKVGSAVILPLIKSSGDKKVHKFIRLRRASGKLFIDIAADSTKEINLIKQKLSAWFETYIDVPEVTGNFDKLLEFIKSGESAHFELIGINYLDDVYKVSVFPQHNLQRNITLYRPIKRKFEGANKEVLDRLVNIRISNKEINTKGQVFVNFYTYLTAGIIGAITLSLDDRKLNATERKKLRDDFETDFGLPLSKLVNFDIISEDQIYRSFLQNTPKKQRKIGLRLDKALDIYKSLLANKLLSLKFDTKDRSCFCFNKDCKLNFQRRWGIKFCKNCGGWMFNDKTIVVDLIDEQKVAEFIYKKCLELNFTAEIFKRKLIRRDLYTVEIRGSDKSICLIPITKPLSNHHLEILQYRYPNAVIITSKDDAQILASSSHVEVLELYKVVPKLLSNNVQFIKQLIQKVNRQRLSRVRSLADESIRRINNIQFYKNKNSIAKNFGAEFFEADCSILLSYIFGNSIWLGANKRGRAFPDGITAMPLTNTKCGCFVWDTKFCETAKVALGKDTKNALYIKDGKKNQTIKDNGGLKGFIFISNVQAPKNFVYKYRKLAKNSGRIKISFVRSEHIKSIFDHFKDHETSINSNSKIKQVFFDSIKKLLFSTAGKKNSYVVDTTELNRMLSNNVREYNLLSTKRVNIK